LVALSMTIETCIMYVDNCAIYRDSITMSIDTFFKHVMQVFYYV
jgi:hypothetical protein